MGDANFHLAMATVVPVTVEKILSMNAVISTSMMFWLHLTLQIGCFRPNADGGADAWAMALLHVVAFAAYYGMWGKTIYWGCKSMEHWGLHTQLAVHGGLLGAERVDISLEGKGTAELLDELPRVALAKAGDRRDYGGKEWTFEAQAVGAQAGAGDGRVAGRGRAAGGIGGGRYRPKAMVSPWF